MDPRHGRNHIGLFYSGAFAPRGLDRSGRGLRRQQQRPDLLDDRGLHHLSVGVSFSAIVSFENSLFGRSFGSLGRG
jgi:hypothetical protein